jgi:hypothetical protein
LPERINTTNDTTKGATCIDEMELNIPNTESTNTIVLHEHIFQHNIFKPINKEKTHDQYDKITWNSTDQQQKTQQRSPDLTGSIKVHRRLVLAIYQQLEDSGLNEVTCNIAAWSYKEGSNPILNVEISERYLARQRADNDQSRNIFDLIAKQAGEDI